MTPELRKLIKRRAKPLNQSVISCFLGLLLRFVVPSTEKLVKLQLLEELKSIYVNYDLTWFLIFKTFKI